MATVKKLFPFMAALFVSLAAAASADAQGGPVVCGTCAEGDFEVRMPDGSIEDCEGCHAFFRGGNRCVGASSLPWAICARCGGTSACHRTPWRGPCHVLCGPRGDDPTDDVRQALADGNVPVVASILMREEEEASLQFIPEAGRINVTLACSPGQISGVIPVYPEFRGRLEAELLARGHVLAIDEPVPYR